jgi:hypothetical protein
MNAVKALLVLLLALVVGGLGIVAVARVREAAARMSCQNNLKQIGLALHNFHDTFERFPTGTVPNPALAPDKRLSWVVEIHPYLEGGVRLLVDRAKPWDDEANCPPRLRFKRYPDSRDSEPKVLPAGEIKLFLCPAGPAYVSSDLPCPTHYAGVAGLGEAAAELPLRDRRAGFFGHDRTVTFDDVKDGQAATAALMEATDGGPWTAGGRATVRGVVPDDAPYLGEHGQFPSAHGDGFFRRRAVANVLLVDGSVRLLTAAASPGVVEALATIAGGEEAPSHAD